MLLMVCTVIFVNSVLNIKTVKTYVCRRAADGAGISVTDLGELATSLTRFGPRFKLDAEKGTAWRFHLINRRADEKIENWATNLLLISIEVPLVGFWIRGLRIERTDVQLATIKAHLEKARLVVGIESYEEAHKQYVPNFVSFIVPSAAKATSEIAMATALTKAVSAGACLAMTIDRYGKTTFCLGIQRVSDDETQQGLFVGEIKTKLYEGFDDLKLHLGSIKPRLWMSLRDVAQMPTSVCLSKETIPSIVRLDRPVPEHAVVIGGEKGHFRHEAWFQVGPHSGNILVVRNDEQVSFAVKVIRGLAARCAAMGEVVVILDSGGKPNLNMRRVRMELIDSEFPPKERLGVLASMVERARPGSIFCFYSSYTGSNALVSLEMMVRAISEQSLQRPVRIFINRLTLVRDHAGSWHTDERRRSTDSVIPVVESVTANDAPVRMRLLETLNNPGRFLRFGFLLAESDVVGHYTRAIWTPLKDFCSTRIYLYGSIQSNTEYPKGWSGWLMDPASGPVCAAMLRDQEPLLVKLDSTLWELPTDTTTYEEPEGESDFTVIPGLGERLVGRLHDNGINTFRELAALTEDELFLILRHSLSDTMGILASARYCAEHGVKAYMDSIGRRAAAPKRATADISDAPDGEDPLYDLPSASSMPKSRPSMPVEPEEVAVDTDLVEDDDLFAAWGSRVTSEAGPAGGKA